MTNKMSDEKILEVLRMLFEDPKKYSWAIRAFAILLDSNHVYIRGQIDVDCTGCTLGQCSLCDQPPNECHCPKVCKCHECEDDQIASGNYVDDVVRYACETFCLCSV